MNLYPRYLNQEWQKFIDDWFREHTERIHTIYGDITIRWTELLRGCLIMKHRLLKEDEYEIQTINS